jgi:hypothetical protein
VETVPPGLRRWSRRIACALAWWLAGLAVDRLVCRAPETPAPVQIGICVVFGIVSCMLLLELAEVAGFRARARWEFLVPVAAYALVWGRQHFLDFLYWDEIVRSNATRLTPWQLGSVLLQPVANGHVMPLARVYWYAIDSVFRADYIGVAAASFLCATACIVSAHALLRFAASTRLSPVALVAATLLAATPHSPLVTLWKGAGDSLLLSMAAFLASMAALAGAFTGRIPFDRRTLAWVVVGLIASLLSSSLLTAVPIFLIPFALWFTVGSARSRTDANKFWTAFVAVSIATLGYGCVRQFVVGSPIHVFPWTWASMSGSLRGALEVFLPSTALIGPFAVGTVGMLVRRKSWKDPATWVWLLGMEMFLAGTAQVVLARGMAYETREQRAEYHLYLAFWGLALASASMIVVAGGGLARIAGRWSLGPRTVMPRIAVAIGLAAYCLFQHLRVERRWPAMTSFPVAHACAPEAVPPGRTKVSVIRSREEFREDLRRYVDGAIALGVRERRRITLPDLALVDSPRFGELALWPSAMDTDPNFADRYRKMTRLGFLMHFFGPMPWKPGLSPLRLVPVDKLERATLASLYRNEATGPFLEKYWPQMEPDGVQ